MKKMLRNIKFIIVIIFLLFFKDSIGQNPISINQAGNNIIVDFQLPLYTLKDTNIMQVYGINQNYSYIKIENFGEINNIGYPQLPQLTIDLVVPNNSTTFNVTTSNLSSEIKTITNRILPTQDSFEESTPVFSINNSYYSSNGAIYSFNYKVSEPFSIMGAKGISLSIFPFQYDPSQNKITVIKKIRFTITTNGTFLKSASKSNVIDEYLSKVFSNYTYLKEGVTDKWRLLVICAPRFETELTYFVNYKRNIGYTVSMVSTNITGTTASNIKTYIKNQYNDLSLRPNFVILVGDIGDIPASAGSEGDVDDPLTDLNYARLEGDDYFADVFIGRLPIFDANTSIELQQLHNILNKTIEMENKLSVLSKSALLFSGSGAGEDRFDNPLRKIMDEGLDGYNKGFLFAIDGKTENDLFSALDTWNYHVLIYRGHGANTQTGDPFNLSGSDIDNRINNSYPLFFSIACNTGNFGFPNGDCLGERWLFSNRGGVAFFGASSVSGRSANQRIAKELFIDAYTERDQLGSIINLGMKRYYKGFWSVFSIGDNNPNNRKNQIKRYNLLGDPTLFVRGFSCIDDLSFNNDEFFYSGNTITYQVVNSITVGGNKVFEIKNGSNVKLIAGNSILLNTGFKVEIGASFEATIAQCKK